MFFEHYIKFPDILIFCLSIKSICGRQVRFSSSKTPRNLTVDSLFIILLFIFNVGRRKGISHYKI